VSLLGTTDASAGWDVGEYLDQSSRVQFVIAMAQEHVPAQLVIVKNARHSFTATGGNDTHHWRGQSNHPGFSGAIPGIRSQHLRAGETWSYG
jgi:hypothetical protein